MPQEEITDKRPTNYSKWHRKLPEWCYLTDGDWFEQRKKNGVFKSVAYVETVQVKEVENANINYPLWSSKMSLCKEIKAKANLPVFIVWHNAECTDFLVLKLGEITPKRMNEVEYKEFIKSL